MTGSHAACVRAARTGVCVALLAVGLQAQQSVRPLIIGATVGASTSLRVSSTVLRVETSGAGGALLVGAISFEAAARTRTDGEVVLTVEALRPVETLSRGPAGEGAVIDFGGVDAGVLAGTLSTTPQAAGRWVGSGRYRGEIVFTLRSAEAARSGTVPLRFVLSTP
jgi:hypothetical protein